MAVSQTIAFMKRTRAGMQGWPLYTAAVRPSSALAHLHMVTAFTTYGSSLHHMGSPATYGYSLCPVGCVGVGGARIAVGEGGARDLAGQRGARARNADLVGARRTCGL